MMSDAELEKLRNDLRRFVEGHYDVIKQRTQFQKLGYVLLGLSIGQALSFFVRRYYMKFSPHWGDWVMLGIGLFGVILVSTILRYNWRLIRAHKAAALGTLGILDTRPGEIMRQHHVEQTLSALDEINRLLPNRLKKLNLKYDLVFTKPPQE
jgi:hypothetical protein